MIVDTYVHQIVVDRSELHNNFSEIENALVVPNGASVVPLTENRLLTPKEYDRDMMHYDFDTQGMSYEVDDSLGVYAHNDNEKMDGDVDDVEQQRQLKRVRIVRVKKEIKRQRKMANQRAMRTGMA